MIKLAKVRLISTMYLFMVASWAVVITVVLIGNLFEYAILPSIAFLFGAERAETIGAGFEMFLDWFDGVVESIDEIGRGMEEEIRRHD